MALQAGGETIDTLKTQLVEAQEKIDMLEKENAMLKGEEKVEEERPPEPTEVQEPPAEAAEEKPAE